MLVNARMRDSSILCKKVRTLFLKHEGNGIIDLRDEGMK